VNENKLFELLTIAKEASLEAGKFLLKPDRTLMNINSDVGRDIKIKADITSEGIIIDYLKECTEFSILSEESNMMERSNREFMWIVDPLDGSLNYSRGIPLCCISIGLWHEMEPVIGVVYDFHRSELYTGISRKGAWLNGKQIVPSAINKKENAVLCTGFPVNTDFSSEQLMTFVQKIQNYKKVRLLGSAALSLSYVASGRADAYMENDIMIWDIAGGSAIASGAGCKLDIRNGSKQNSLHVAVSNGNFRAG
jgi:fructose-1,6-bisphosphatase/inositol monophosphatase family enzyme